MAPAPDYLIDTNILLRLSRLDDPQHELVMKAVNQLNEDGAGLYFSLQNIAEFWNVCTRPAERNGYGLTCAETNLMIETAGNTIDYLPDNEHVYGIWRELVLAHSVRGVQVHDAHLVATMRAHGVSHILTLNRTDFLRFAEVQAVHPAQVQPAAR